MQALLAPSLLLPLVGRLTATSRMHRSEVAQAKPWEAILSLQGAREGGAGALIELGAKQTTSNVSEVRAMTIVRQFESLVHSEVEESL